jgi:hypothetical protein
MEMSFSALYMHELHRRRILNPLNPYFDNDDGGAMAMRQYQDSPSKGGGTAGQYLDPNLRFSFRMMDKEQSRGYGREYEGQGEITDMSLGQLGEVDDMFLQNMDAYSRPRLFANQGQCLDADIELHPLTLPGGIMDLPSPSTTGHSDQPFPSNQHLHYHHGNQGLPQVQGPYGSSSARPVQGHLGGGSAMNLPNIQEVNDEDERNSLSLESRTMGKSSEKMPLIEKDDSLHEL